MSRSGGRRPLFFIEMRFNLAGPSSNPGNCHPPVKEGLADVSEQHDARTNDGSTPDVSLARTRADDKTLKDLIKLFLSMLSYETAHEDVYA